MCFSKTSSSFLVFLSRRDLKMHMSTSPEVPLLFYLFENFHFEVKITCYLYPKELLLLSLNWQIRPIWWLLKHYLIVQLVFLPDDNWLQAVSSGLSCLICKVQWKAGEKKKKDILFWDSTEIEDTGMLLFSKLVRVKIIELFLKHAHCPIDND